MTKQDWSTLTQMSQGREITVKKVQIEENEVQIEGHFELPPLAKLTMEDQVFVASFIKAHGSIKEMERLFGISYPTVKARLSKISASFSFIKVEDHQNKESILDQLDAGEVTVDEALKKLGKT